MLQQSESVTPLQKRMSDFGKKLSYIILLICILLFVVGLLRGEKPLNMLLISISLAVAAIPEALPALITIALARGASRLVRKETRVAGRSRFFCSGHPRGLAGRGHRAAGAGRAQDGDVQRIDPASALGRNTGLGHLYLF